MLNIIACVQKCNFGIGFKNELPWYEPSDLKFFKKITSKTLENKNNILIFGKNTFNNLPISFKNSTTSSRRIAILSKTQPKMTDISVIHLRNENDLLNLIKDKKYNVWICGGQSLYKLVLNNKKFIPKIDKLNITFLEKKNGEPYECDTFFPKIPIFMKKKNSLKIITQKHFLEFVEYENIVDVFSNENQYLNLLKTILKKGQLKKGRNGMYKSVFAKTQCYDMKDGFPLLTTKDVFFRGIVEELLFFLRGSTDSKELEKKGINIWKWNTNKEFLKNRGLDYDEGFMGPMYGYQLRRKGSKYNGKRDVNGNEIKEKGFDQLFKILNTLKNDPFSRRHVMSTYDPIDEEKSCLAVCHGLVIVFYVREVNNTFYLDLSMNQRSIDVPVGFPFNLASYALLLHIISFVLGYIPGRLYTFLNNCHVYENQIEDVKEQLKRIPLKKPKLEIKKEKIKFKSVEEMIKFIENLKFKDFKLFNYNHYPKIKYKMNA